MIGYNGLGSDQGELAQLGERLRGTQEVVGSSPIFSINTYKKTRPLMS